MSSTMAASLIKPDYASRAIRRPPEYRLRTSSEDTVGPLPAIKLAIPKTTFTAPKNGLPVNPSPHAGIVDPAIQFPVGGRVSPSFLELQRSPEVEQGEFLLPIDASVHRFVDCAQDKGTQTDDYNLSRSSSQASLSGKQYCHGCQRRLGHSRSNSYSSNTSSTKSASATPETSSPEMADLPKRSSSTFGRKFKFNLLQRSSSMPARDSTKALTDGEDEVKQSRKKSVSKGKPAKRVEFEMVTTDDHWTDE